MPSVINRCYSLSHGFLLMHSIHVLFGPKKSIGNIHHTHSTLTLTLFPNQIFFTLTQYWSSTDPEIRNCLLCNIGWQWGSCLFSLKIVVLPSSIVNGCFKTCAFFGDYKLYNVYHVPQDDVQSSKPLITFRLYSSISSSFRLGQNRKDYVCLSAK